MVLDYVGREQEKLYNSVAKLILRHKKISFFLASILAVIITSFFSFFDKSGFNIIKVSIISLFSILIFYNMLVASKNYRKNIAYVFTLSGLFQLFLAFFFFGAEFDISADYNFAKVVEKGGNFYNELGPLYNYSPAWAWITFLILKISNLTSIAFQTILKLPMIVATLGIGYLLYKIMLLNGRDYNDMYFVLAAYLFNPITLMVSGYHGKFDNLSIFFLVLYSYILLKSQKINPFSSLIYGISILMEQITVFAIPFFFLKQRNFLRKTLYLFFISFPFLFFISFYLKDSFIAIIKYVLLHPGSPNNWGYSRIIAFLTTEFSISYNPVVLKFVYTLIVILMFLLMLYYFYKNKHVNYLDGIIISFLFYYAFTPGFGIQSLIWILPFIALKAVDMKKHFFFLYSLLGSLAGLLFYFGEANKNYFIRDVLGLSMIGEPLWIFTIFWLLWHLRNAKLEAIQNSA